MTGPQEDYLNMLYAIKVIIDKYNSTWVANAVFAASYGIVTTTIPLIEQNRDAQMTTSKGITTDKGVKRVTLTDKALFIINRIQSYATVTVNNDLLESVHFTQSTFDKSRDTDIVGICDTIIAKANANITALATYGVTAALVTDLQTALTAYSSYIAKPRTVKAQSKNATENLALYFKQANDAVTTRLDLDIEVYKTSKPDFYSQYWTARVVIDTTGSASAVKGVVKVKDSGELLKNVTLTFTPNVTSLAKTANATNSAELVKKTAEKGQFRIANLAEGTYMVTIHKIGYKDQVITINVANGETTQIIIELEKA
jgi:hypothetical protein